MSPCLRPDCAARLGGVVNHGEPTYQLRLPTVAVWREPGVLQVGLDADAVVLEGVGELATEAVSHLHSPMTVTELAHRLPGIEPDLTRRLCAHLSSAGLLTTEPAPAAASVAVLGQGPLADAVAHALIRAQVRCHRLPDDAVADRCDPHALVVVATATVEPDRVVLARLRSAGRSYLVVRLEPSRAVVGPLVLAEEPGCVHCDDLVHAEHDPAWARLLDQLCRLAVTPDPGLLSWAVASAVNQVRAWQGGAASELHNRCLAVSAPGFAQSVRHWRAQPSCWCAGPGAD